MATKIHIFSCASKGPLNFAMFINSMEHLPKLQDCSNAPLNNHLCSASFPLVSLCYSVSKQGATMQASDQEMFRGQLFCTKI